MLSEVGEALKAPSFFKKQKVSRWLAAEVTNTVAEAKVAEVTNTGAEAKVVDRCSSLANLYGIWVLFKEV